MNPPTGGSGDIGTFTGYDVITDFTAGAGGDVLDLVDTTVLGNATVDGTDSALTISGQAIRSHQVTNGIITFDDQNAYAAALTLSSLANVAAAVNYVNLNDFAGGGGDVVAFVANIGGIAHTYVINQLGNAPDANDILVDLVGITLTNVSGANLAPAGVAGEAINLALTNPADHVGAFIVNISGVPAGWILSQGTNNGDGTWSVLTNDVTTLTITTPADYAGAVMLKMSVTWTDSTGGTGLSMITNNVEAYSAGSPIFALSANDNLTGSTNADTFVFAQPIGNNIIFNFDAAADKIDLIGFAGITSYANLSIADDANGNAVVSISDGQTITIKGVDAAALSAANFEFDVDPVTVNVGLIAISDGAIMPFGGSIVNSGTISLDAADSETSLEILFRGVTLTGGGEVLLSDSANNVIFGGTADTVLTNVDNVITGAGQLGAGQLTLVNEGTIVANGSNALIIDTGLNIVTNDGTMEATGSGGLIINGDLSNNGMLWANNGDITITGNVSGSGYAVIEGSAQLEFGAASSENTTFAAVGDGTLKLDQSDDYTGTVSGFNEGDRLMLSDLLVDENTTLAFAENQDGTGGLLTVSDGTHTANVAMAGDYDAVGFQLAADSNGSAVISYLLNQNQPIV